MKRFFMTSVMAAAFSLPLLFSSCSSAAPTAKASAAPEAGEVTKVKERKDVPAEYKWDLTHVYKTMDAFEADVKKAQDLTQKMKSFEGKLGTLEDAKQALDTFYTGQETLWLLDSYAGNQKNSEISNTEYQALAGRVEGMFTDFLSAASFMDPEFLALPEETLKSYMSDPSMKEYDRYFTQLLRLKPHILTKGEEKIVADYTAMEYAEYETYNTFSSSELPTPKFTLPDGKTIELTHSAYYEYRVLPDRNTRKALFESFWKLYNDYKNTFSKMLNYQTKYYETVAKVRKFPSALDKKLFSNEIPYEFYGNLINHIHGILPSLHEYMVLKKETLNVPKVEFYDMYVPIVDSDYKGVFTYAQARELILKSLRMMPKEYQEAMKLGMTPGNGWIDVYPTKDKYTGAYCNGAAYSIHPYVIMNWTDNYESMSTLAHEMGHAMHSYFSNKYQSFPKADYSMFVAEVSSIFNEVLLINYMIDNAKSKEEKIYLLNYFIEMIRTTVFRQALFAEFEKIFHDKVMGGETLTSDYLSDEYLKLNNQYYGADKGLYQMQPEYKIEWAYIPHFYYNYYVYQYVVGYIGALSLATKVLDGKIKPEQYVNGLSKGGQSKPPLEILKDAGIDMMSPEPYELTGKVFEKRLAELKALLKDSPAKEKK